MEAILGPRQEALGQMSAYTHPILEGCSREAPLVERCEGEDGFGS